MLVHQLHTFINIADKLIDKKSTLPLLTHVCFDKGTIKATDLELSLFMEIESDIRVTIPAGILKKILKTKPATIKMQLKDESKVKINYDNKTLTCQGDSVDDYPNIKLPTGRSIGTWPVDVMRHLHALLPFCSEDEMRPNLTGVYVNQNGKLECCATSGHILRWLPDALSNGRKNKARFKGIIPKKAIGILSRCVKDHVKVKRTDDKLIFELDKGLHLMVKLIDATYPTFKNVIPQDYLGTLHLSRKPLLHILADAKSYANRYNHQGIIEVDDNTLSLHVSDIEDGIQWQADLDVKNKSGPDLKMGLDLVLLERILKTLTTTDMVWHYNAPNSAVIITESDDSNVEAINLMMPIRLKEDDDE